MTETTGKAVLITTAVLLAIAFLSAACASRYRLDLYLTLEESRQSISVEATQFVMDAAIGNPYGDDKVEVGPGNVAVVTIGTRGVRVEGHRWSALGFDEYFRCQIYLQVHPRPKRDSLILVDRSLVHILGRYELPIEERVFLPREGYYIVDSVTDRSIFFTIDGSFANKTGDQIEFDGRFQVHHNR